MARLGKLNINGVMFVQPGGVGHKARIKEKSRNANLSIGAVAAAVLGKDH